METALPSSTSEYVKQIVKAGAGAGKTHDLIEKIYRMVSPDHVPHIIVCTFTKKATQELKERIIKKALSDKEQHPKKFRAMLNFIKSPSFLHISTIHGVLTLFLQTQGGSIGLDPEFSIVEDAESLKLQKKLFFDYVSSSDPRALELYRNWGWQKLQYILEKHREARAFNPKLTPLEPTTIISALREQKNLILKNIAELILQIEPHALKNQTSALFQFFTQLKNFANHLEFFEIHCASDAKGATPIIPNLIDLYENIPQRLGSLKGIDESIKELKRQVHEECLQFIHEPFLMPETLIRFEKQNCLFNEFSHEYNKKLELLKIDSAELSIKDLELFALNLITEHPQTAQIFSQKWDYWFIDEFQDTSPIQVKLLKSLIGDKNYYLVGDPQQSIYFFRGARSQIFKEEWAHLLKAGHITEEKVVNRRSQAQLLYFINDFMISLNQKQFSEMHPFHKVNNKHDPVAEIHIAQSPEQNEISMLINQVNTLVDAGVTPSQLAILCRENKELIEILKQSKSIHAPLQIIGKGNFFERFEVKDALSAYRFLQNPHDDRNLLTLLKSPLFSINDQDLLPFVKKADSIWSIFLQNNNLVVAKKLQDLLALAQTEGLFLTWIRFLKETRIFSHYKKEDPTGIAEANIWKLIFLIQEDLLPLQFQSESNAVPAESQDAIQLMTVHASKGLEFEYVFLPFLDHNIKKANVENFMLDLNNQNYVLPVDGHHPPWSYDITRQTDLFLTEESERLLYVAVTRAKNKILFFLNSDYQQSKSNWVKHISRFVKDENGLYEIDDKYSLAIKYY